MNTKLPQDSAVADESTINHACACFLDLRQRLPPTAVAEIDKVLADLPIDPRTATAEQAWRRIWDKPLFANTKVETGWRWINELMPYMENSWQTWGADPTVFLITHTGRGKQEASFSLEGKEGSRVRAASRVAIHRLFAIQNAALVLRRLTEHSDKPVALFWSEPLDTLLPQMVHDLGWGWGATTVFHMLLDFGVASKPDIHVIRSLRHLGIWNTSRDQVNMSEGLAVNRAIRAMACHLGELTPARLRRLDIELMSLSRYGVIGSS